METTDYVSYPIALALKKAGFDWKCDHYWYKVYTDSDKMEMRQASADDYNNDDWSVPHYSAPTLWHTQKWLRDVKGIDICVWRSFSVSHGYHYQIVSNNDWENAEMQTVCKGRNYEQSLSDAINAALELIENEKE